MPEVGAPSGRHAHGIRPGFREAVEDSPGTPQEAVIGTEHPRPGCNGQESEEQSKLYALLHCGEILQGIFQSNLRAVASASRALMAGCREPDIWLLNPLVLI